MMMRTFFNDDFFAKLCPPFAFFAVKFSAEDANDCTKKMERMRKKILTVIGTRPNYIKVTQFEKEFSKHPDHFEHRLLHTGQHFDKVMKDIFFEQLQLKKIDYALEVTHGTPGSQIGEIIMKMDAVLQEWKPDLVMVVGDVNSTLAASIAANKANIKLAHVEAGLRSGEHFRRAPRVWLQP